jgi:FixJ family two-component response regulator
MISVIDDDNSVRKALIRLIKTAGYDAVAFGSAEEFLAADVLAQTRCLILDVHLPGKSGLELQAELASSAANCPIVFITAFDDERARAQALDTGAVQFLNKPLDSKILIEAIDAALKRGTTPTTDE